MLQKRTVEAGTLALIGQLMNDKHLRAFNLVGGTALALKIGHRSSIDIDLFTNLDFDPSTIASHLSSAFKAQRISTLKNAIFCFIEDVKVDLIAHKYPLVAPVEIVEGVRMVSLTDIAAMKLHAISNNGTRLKDFIDIYFLLEKMPLGEMLSAYEKKYTDVNALMAKTALLYHNDIDFTVRVAYVKNKVDWKNIKARLKISATHLDKIFPSQ